MQRFPFRPEAALIDMDGVLYDTMPSHAAAWEHMISDLGIPCTREEFFAYEGMTGVATIDLIFRRHYGHGVDPEEARRLYAIKARYFQEFGRKHRMPGADRMLAAFSDAGIPRVLVTGSAQHSVLDEIHADYPGMFPDGMRITAHDVVHGKPHPEPYLRGAALANAAPERCVVVENAPLGVKAGADAGCFVVAVMTGPIPREEFVKAGANLIFESMPEFAEALPGLIPDV